MDHTREHHSLLAPTERRLLVAIARRLPPWLSPDHLTLLGLFSLGAAGLAFSLLTTPWGAPALAMALAANWFGDSLDGTLARVRAQQRPRYGYYVDHVIDLVSAEAYLATDAVGIFRLSCAGIGPTELRILIAAGGFYVAAHPWVDLAGTRVRPLDLGGTIATIALAVVFVAAAIRNSCALFLAEPRP